MKKMIPHNMIWKPLALLTIIAALASCTDDFLLPETPSYEGENDGRIHFSVLPPASAEVEMMTRATIPATDPEKAIYTLRIMIFDGDGNIIPDEAFKLFDNSFTTTVFGAGNIGSDGNMIASPKAFNANKGFSLPVFTRPVYYSVTTSTDGGTETTYVHGTTEPTGYSKSPITNADGTTTEYFCLDPEKNLKNCQIWALANMGRWENSLVNHLDEGIGSLDDVRTLDQLRRFYGKREAKDFAENRPFLPMVGTLRGDADLPVLDPKDDSRIIERSDGTYLTFSGIFGSGATAPAPAGYSYAEPGDLDLTAPTAIGSPKKIRMDQIVAKVRFNITMPEEQTSTTEGDLTITDDAGTKHSVQSLKWEFYFDNWTVENLPRYTYIIPHRKDIADYVSNGTYSQAAFGTDASSNAFHTNGLYMPDENKGDNAAAFEHNGFGDGESTGDWIGPGKTSPNANAADDANEGSYIYSPTGGQYYYHFYTYGNRRGGRGAANVANLSGTTANYGSYSKEDNGNLETFKTLYAPKDATFLVLRGIVRRTYVDMSGVTKTESRSVCYKIALGCNRTDDYNVYRNTCYTLHIKINGFDQNDLQVTTENNYNSSVHRRFQMAVRAPYLDQMDCHYDMRYVQFTGVSDSKQQRDVRLRIYGSEADASTENKSTDGTVVEGYGNENHGSSAVSWLKVGVHDLGGHDYGTVTDIENVDQKDIFSAGNEKTFCIHSEEYVSDGNGNTPTENRKAWLQIRQTYHGLSDVLESLSDTGKNVGGDYLGVAQRTLDKEDGTTETVYDVYFLYPIEQYPPIEVNYTYYDDNGYRNPGTLLVERFEEYTMSLDPGINMPSADGLQWGFSRYLPNNTGSEYSFYDFSTEDETTNNTTGNGKQNTVQIVTGAVGASQPASGDFVNTSFVRYSFHEDYAARYCYDKGIEGNRSWYLPSIYELNGLTASETLAGIMNTSNDSNADGPIFWSSTTYIYPDNYPPELKSYWTEYHNNRTIGGYTAYQQARTAAWLKGEIYLWYPVFGQKYSASYFREVWNYMEQENNRTDLEYPFNCSVASCNGTRYLKGYSRKWEADNKDVEGHFLQRSEKYRVRAVRKKPQ